MSSRFWAGKTSVLSVLWKQQSKVTYLSKLIGKHVIPHLEAKELRGERVWGSPMVSVLLRIVIVHLHYVPESAAKLARCCT